MIHLQATIKCLNHLTSKQKEQMFKFDQDLPLYNSLYLYQQLGMQEGEREI